MTPCSNLTLWGTPREDVVCGDCDGHGEVARPFVPPGASEFAEGGVPAPTQEDADSPGAIPGGMGLSGPGSAGESESVTARSKASTPSASCPHPQCLNGMIADESDVAGTLSPCPVCAEPEGPSK